MTKTQYRAALAALGLTQAEAAEFLGFGIRSSSGYANGWEIPVAVVKALALSVYVGLPTDEIDEICERTIKQHLSGRK